MAIYTMAMLNNQMVHPFDARTLCVSAINLIEPIANLQQTKVPQNRY